MKVLFFILAIGSAALGFLALMRGAESYLEGRTNFLLFILGALGWVLGIFWLKKAKRVR